MSHFLSMHLEGAIARKKNDMLKANKSSSPGLPSDRQQAPAEKAKYGSLRSTIKDYAKGMERKSQRQFEKSSQYRYPTKNGG